jgi:hypothetical protein
LALPTGNPAWLACLSFATFFLFALLPPLLYNAMPPGKAGYAPGWQLRCPGCGRVKDAGEAGIIRIQASGNKRILGRCGQCQCLRWLHLERVPESTDAGVPGVGDVGS